MEWHTQSAYVTGRGHLAQNLPCQDRTCTMTRNGVTAVALSDGAGSAPMSQEGAACAVQTVCELLCEEFERYSTTAAAHEMRTELLTVVRDGIVRRAQQLGVHYTALACTLLAVAVKGDRYLLFHLGDGVIGYQKNGKLLVASSPDNGEFANTTVFVTSSRALASARVMRGIQPAMEGFLLMSDGCEAAMYHKTRKKLAPLAGHLFLRAELLNAQIAEKQLEKLLQTLISGCTTDDCSMALLSRTTNTFGHWEKLNHQQQAAVLGIMTQNRNRRRRMIRRYAVAFGVKTSSAG